MTTMLTIKDGTIVLPAHMRERLVGAHMHLSEQGGHIIIEGHVQDPAKVTMKENPWTMTAGILSPKTARALLRLTKQARKESDVRLRAQDKLWKKLRS